MEKFDWAFIDFQGFKDNSNRFIVKEFAVKTKNLKFHDIIKSPKADSVAILDKEHQKQAKWLTENYHGLEWNSGYISLSELRNIIVTILSKKVVYVKGEEKVKWLENILKTQRKNICKIINVETIGCTININKNTSCQQYTKFHACNKHTGLKENKTKNLKCHCAMKNVSILSDWYFSKNKKTES